MQNGAAEQLSLKKEIALMEVKMQRLCELLKEVCFFSIQFVCCHYSVLSHLKHIACSAAWSFVIDSLQSTIWNL